MSPIYLSHKADSRESDVPTVSHYQEVLSKRFLIVEGSDDLSVLDALCNHLGIEDIHLYALGCNTTERLNAVLSLVIKGRKYTQGEIESIGIIVDSDRDRDAAFERVQTVLRNYSYHNIPNCAYSFLPVNRNLNYPKVGIYLIPKPNANGTLENLLLESVLEHPAISIVDNFFDAINNIQPVSAESKQAKIKARAFILTHRDVNNSIGQAAKKGYWNFDHQSFESLKTFINEM